ncbi:serine hydrolase domain-containing protein [Fimbriiglobus ruber]|uniref:Esterase n=1 Tax=Fimbriiglobus ruber TaxID=1908690 RepID=A0A225E0E0_9BACT|nr:serine hydrolase domain-containing protein [Fimbriiglobus ruber]OWK47200.1 esterase [Fimbriiglobus ruber]
MRAWIFAGLACGFFLDHQPAPAAEPQFGAVDEAVKAAFARGDCPGAVVVVVHNDEVILRKAYGNRVVRPALVPMTVDTVFDLASLTKPIATATSAMLLIEHGKLSPDDLVAKYWPAFAANGKDKITIANLLLHNSGLIADNPEADYKDGPAKALERIAALKPEAPVGSRFKYSDVGFIVLGVVVERVAGQPMDKFAKMHVYDPLKMTDTGFRPGEPLKARIAPTGQRAGKIILGEVHDPRAYLLGGVAGDAGLFAPADDLVRYIRMLLRGGELDGVRVMKPETVKLFTDPHEVLSGTDTPAKGTPRKQFRSYGWDVDTAYSSQRGDLFPRGEGYGHTGFTGTSVWVDPASKTAVIILTNRVHPDDKGNAIRLRREVATAVAAAVGIKPRNDRNGKEEQSGEKK